MLEIKLNDSISACYCTLVSHTDQTKTFSSQYVSVLQLIYTVFEQNKLTFKLIVSLELFKVNIT
jgi:hypothetical protein